MKSNYLFAALLSLVFISCDKKDDDSAGGETKTQLITSSSWKYESAGLDYDRNGTIENDIDAYITPCFKDNVISFSADGTGTILEGSNVCAGTAASTAIIWSFSTNEQSLNLGGSSIVLLGGTFKILNLTNTTLSLGKDTSILPLYSNVQLIFNLKH